MTQRPAKDLDKFIIRLPDGMRERIAVAAAMNSRSMTAEIVSRLEASFAEDEATRSKLAADRILRMGPTLTIDTDPMEARMKKLEGRVAVLEDKVK